MASKSLISWGAGLLLAATLGCSSGTVTQGTCPPGTTFCNGACTATAGDNFNCGQCGNVCSTTNGQSCQVGVCSCDATKGYKTCGTSNACIATWTDANNCGSCGTVCSGTNNLCQQGSCVANCSGSQTKCGNSCVDTKTSSTNCGACGTTCSNTQTCTNGACVNNQTTGVGGATGQGGATTQSGGSGQGGANTSVGGASTGGAVQQGGSNQGGAATGGAQTQGGSSQGGAATGGAQNRGGSSSGGAATGGTTTTTSTGGVTNAGGTTSTGTRPAGYYYTADWSVTSVDWHGCVWTGIDTVASTKTTITPQDFMSGTNGGPYQVTGSVNGDYKSVALLGFNIAEPIGTNANQCKYDATKATANGPPSASMASITSSKTGLAINWTAKTKPGQFRVQLQEPDCASNLAHCYCATITDATGPSFVKWTDFYAYCWNYPTVVDTAVGAAVQYKNQDVDAVVFLVPGVTTATPFDFTVVGFAPGNSAADAPGKAVGCGQQTGTLGNGGPSQDASMQRMAVTDSNCKKYVAFNNNWGQPTTTSQIIDFVGNSFTVKSSQAAVSGQGVPGSFPSIYIGANGDLGGGTFNTWSDSGLPKQISAIASIQTSLTWSGGTSGGDFNTTYDVWFAKSAPTAGGYNDGISGLLMVWLYKPSSRSPIGKIVRTATGVAGHNWDVWVGPRGVASTGTDAAGRPVVSYVAKDSPVSSLSFDLKAFITDAVTNGAADMSAGGTSQAFASSWYLTDVFGGFEIWSGGAASGLKETFTCVVK